MKNIAILLITILLYSCANRKWNYSQYKYMGKVSPVNDSILVTVNNPVNAPLRFNIMSSISEVDSILKNYRPFPAKPFEVVQFKFKPKHPLNIKILEKSMKFKSVLGNVNDIKLDSSTRYTLPFLKGKTYEILQSYNGTFTHNSSHSKNAIDFKMKRGDTICAVRKGIVVGIVNRNKKGGRGKRFINYANFVTLYHEDGTFSGYSHIMYKGSLVKLGDTISSGQPIALCGNTGFSTTPHLHFVTFKPTDKGTETFPIKFNEVSGIDLKKGVRIKRKI